MVSTPFNVAATAYGNASRLLGQSGRTELESAAVTAAPGPDFAQMLAQSVQGVVEKRAADPIGVSMFGELASATLQRAAPTGRAVWHA